MTGSKEGDLLHGTSKPSGGYTGDNLLPKEGAHLVIRILDRSWSLCKMKLPTPSRTLQVHCSMFRGTVEKSRLPNSMMRTWKREI